MARQLEQYDPLEDNESPPGRPPDYPWHEWLNGKIWEIKHGVDFHCKMDTMAMHVRRTAARYDIRISVYRKDDITFVIKPRD